MPPNDLYATLLLLSALASGGIALAAWQRRRAPGATPLALLAAAMAWWSATYALHWTAFFRPSHFFWLDLTYVGVVSAPVCIWLFSLQYTGRAHWISRGMLGALTGTTALTILVLLTDPHHGLFFGGRRDPAASSIFAGGPWFWANLIYCYGLFLAALVVLVVSLRHKARIYRAQTWVLIGGLLVPWACNVLCLAGLTPWPDLDLSPVAFTLSGLILAIGLFRYRWLDIVPVARDLLIESMRDGVLVLDDRNRIVDLNPAAWRLTGCDGGDPIGREITALLGEQAALLTGEPIESAQPDIIIQGAGARELELRSVPLVQGNGASQGRLVILRDISERRRLEQEREGIISSLQEALGQVRTLEGLLPICSHCKRIRDDDGHWERIEVYIRRHSAAEFTHSICPECLRSLFPGLVE